MDPKIQGFTTPTRLPGPNLGHHTSEVQSVFQPSDEIGGSGAPWNLEEKAHGDFSGKTEVLYLLHGADFFFAHTMWSPSDVCSFINPMNTIVISIINHSYWSYKPT